MDFDCAACEELKETSPDLICNGFSEEMCTALKNNKGLVVGDGNDDCDDLNNMNDCLVGNMAEEVETLDPCDLKSFIKDLIDNLWTVLKGIICAVCGLWTNVSNLWSKLNCTYNAFSRLVNELAKTTGGTAFVRYYRDLGAGSGVPYWTNLVAGESHTLDIYMDSTGIDSGTKSADRDYVVMISNCTNYKHFNDFAGRVTFYSSGDTRSIVDIRSHQGQHPDMKFQGDTEQVANFSWTTSGAVLLRKGEHIKVNFYVDSVNKGSATDPDAPSARLHQFILTWIPINVSEPLDPDDYLTC